MIILQLSGLLVLTVGLWLRFDSAKFPPGDGAPETFFIGMSPFFKSASLNIKVVTIIKFQTQYQYREKNLMLDAIFDRLPLE